MRVYVAGKFGMVGSSISRLLEATGVEVFGQRSRVLDLRKRDLVFREIHQTRPDALIVSAAVVGGIAANSSRPVDFLSQNLQIQTNLLDAAHEYDIKRVLFLGSSCIYPKYASQPIKEEFLLCGELEQTNEAYAIAKIAGLKLVQAYRAQFQRKWISAMPTNLYGPGDNFNLSSSHVLPALINRIHQAKLKGSDNVQIWGDGTPLREFLHVDDLARALMLLLDNYDSDEIINIGSGHEISISALAQLVASIIGFEGQIDYDFSKPNGTPRKLLDSTRINNLGWQAQVSLEDGVSSTYDWYLRNIDARRTQ